MTVKKQPAYQPIADIMPFWQGSKKSPVFGERFEDKVTKLLSDKGSLVARDIAIFVYDRNFVEGTER